MSFQNIGRYIINPQLSQRFGSAGSIYRPTVDLNARIVKSLNIFLRQYLIVNVNVKSIVDNPLNYLLRHFLKQILHGLFGKEFAHLKKIVVHKGNKDDVLNTMA